MNIAVLGYGTVGKSVCGILSRTKTGFAVTRILRKNGPFDDPRMTASFDSILADSSIEAVVDALPGTEPSRTYIQQAICAGKHVVTANKAALYADLPSLWALADAHQVSLRYEASCGGALPIIEEAVRLGQLDEISQVSGILNGTCNYILWQMEQNGTEFDAALSNAQALGFAEADPTADISGADVRNKAFLLSSTAFRGFVSQDIPVYGISKITKARLDAFRAEGKCLRLMMLARQKGNAYAVGVVPVVLPKETLEAHVPAHYNLASLCGNYSGKLKFYGQGAGGDATADAIVRDLLSLSRGEKLPKNLFSKKLCCDASLLTGRGYFGDTKAEAISLSALCKEAAKLDCFAAFEPDDFFSDNAG